MRVDGALISTPTIEHVIEYDLQLRKQTAKLMNEEGVTFLEGLKRAKEDTRHFHMHFAGPVSLAINTPQCRACTAPLAVLDRRGREGPHKPPPPWRLG